jgi:hypothetical protein
MPGFKNRQNRASLSLQGVPSSGSKATRWGGGPVLAERHFAGMVDSWPGLR